MELGGVWMAVARHLVSQRGTVGFAVPLIIAGPGSYEDKHECWARMSTLLLGLPRLWLGSLSGGSALTIFNEPQLVMREAGVNFVCELIQTNRLIDDDVH